MDTTKDGYELLSLSLDGTTPRFTPSAKAQAIPEQELTIYYDMQCPFILQRVELVQAHCQEKGFPVTFHPVEMLEQAKALPCVFNNWAVFYQGQFQTVNLLDIPTLERILKRGKQ